MIKNLTRLAMAAVVATSLTGCFSMSMNAGSLTKPVSMSPHIGRPAQVLRHFKVDCVTWYGLGLIPLATVPGGPGFGTTADKLVSGIISDELKKGGDGVVNLRVKQEYELISILIPFGIGIIFNFVPVPFLGTLVTNLLRPIGVSVEGDVVSFKGRALAPTSGPVITRGEKGELDLGGADVNGMFSVILEKAAKQQQAEKAAK